VRRRAVTEDCLESEGEERRDLVGVLGGDGADQVDTAVQFDQAPGSHAQLNLASARPGRQEPFADSGWRRAPRGLSRARAASAPT